ncbi:nuclear transport factor 2 family protein [Nocardioides carbamazepini]|uniref:hypothetical protein n=1 Tax=Nocardioides carbamazepini TaxID=2854259 RepID=UPI002149FE3A|nr:hypothetical protein [Nocardioides carbamazepini]MCR1785134.1 nuclear transport factor 2 family protein [Nocardioides carbamazepini]
MRTTIGSLAERLTWRSGAVVLVAVALLLVTGQRALAWQDERGRVASARDAVAAATAEVEGLIDISAATSADDMAALLDGATASFRSELESQADRLRQALTDNAVEASGDVVSAGVVKLDGDRATVVVAAVGTVRNKQTDAAEPRNYRLAVDLQRTKGAWLVSGLEFVA